MIISTALTKGCLPAIMAHAPNHVEKPVLQVLGTKKVIGAGGSERYRLLLSDGQYLQSFAMLSTHLNDLVVNGNLSEHTIICVKNYTTSIVGEDKRVLIIIDLEVLQKGEEVGMEMGKPINFDSMDSAKTNSGTLKHVSTSPVDLHAKIAQLEAQNSQQQAEIDAKDAKIAEQNRKISELVAKIADHGVKIEKLEVSIGEMLHSLPNA